MYSHICILLQILFFINIKKLLQSPRQNIMKTKITIAVIGILIQLVQFCKKKTAILKKTDLLNIVNQLSILTPTELIKNFDKLQDYGLCVGKAYGSQKIKSMLQPKTSVIISRLYQIKSYSIRDQLRKFTVKKLLKTRRPAYFTLNDSYSNIPILQTANLPIKTIEYVTKANQFQRRSIIRFLIELISSLKNINIPYLTQSYWCQKIFPENETMAVLGKYKRQISGKITCQKPIMMGANKQEIIFKIKKTLSYLKIYKYLFVFGMAFSVGYIMKQLHKFYLNQRKRKEDPIQNYQKLYVKSRICFNCKSKMSSFILQACGHMTMCVECKQKLKVCGECKKTGTKGIQLYAS